MLLESIKIQEFADVFPKNDDSQECSGMCTDVEEAEVVCNVTKRASISKKPEV